MVIVVDCSSGSGSMVVVAEALYIRIFFKAILYHIPAHVPRLVRLYYTRVQSVSHDDSDRQWVNGLCRRWSDIAVHDARWVIERTK